MPPLVERLFEIESGKVQVDTSGDGPDFVIVHSLLTGPEAFDQVASTLAEHRTVHRVHLPGFGASTPLPSSNVTVAELADLVAATISQIGCNREETVLLGNGLGSFVTLSLAIRHGKDFGPLIACNTGPGFTEEGRRAFRTMSDLATTGGMSAVIDVAVGRIFPPSYVEAHPEAPAERSAVLETIDPGAFAAACRALASLDLREQLATIVNPTLILVGEIDQTTPPPMAREVAGAIPEAVLVEIPDCGHCPQLEQPEALLASIDRFLSDLPDRGAS
jgi:3-oxoadipate enol-lactonase